MEGLGDQVVTDRVLRTAISERRLTGALITLAAFMAIGFTECRRQRKSGRC